MNPVNFEDMNCIFKAEGCGDLPALKTDKHIVSCWEMTEKEKEEFIKTGITPKDYLDFVCSILHISRKVKIILLDGTVQEAKILDFLDMSYDLTDGRIEESIE